ncbi:MAG: ABC transporter permease [Lachnospirales bacterium]
MLTIIKKEIWNYFTTMTGYIYLAAFIITTAFLFINYNVLGGYADFSYAIYGTLNIFLILVPIITMRLFAEETKSGTDQLLFTAPVHTRTIVVAKFLGAISLFLIGFAVTLTFPLLLSGFGEVPFQKLIGVIIGYGLLISSFISVGVFISSLTNNQIIAAVGTFGSMFVFLYMDSIASAFPVSRIASMIFLFAIVCCIGFILYDSTKNIFVSITSIIVGAIIIAIIYFLEPTLLDSTMSKVLTWFSPIGRFRDSSVGILNLSNMIYFATFIIAFVYLTINNIEKRRWK